MMITLTICITTHNRWELCINALRSLCRQEGIVSEVILVDDCSTDPMPQYIADFIEDKHVIYVQHERNTGLAMARNTAIDRACGKYFTFCDDDDQWPQGYAVALVRAMKEGRPDVGMAVGLPRELQMVCRNIFEGYPKLSWLFVQGFTPPVGAQIYRTELIKKIGGYTPTVRSGVDHDLWVNLLEVDPKVSVSWGGHVVVGRDVTRKRLTTVEGLRRSGIREALEIWHPKIVDALGEDFYQHFCYSYDQYLDYSFFKKIFHEKKISEIFTRASNWNMVQLLMGKVYNKIICRKRCNNFPKYKYK